MKNEYLIHSKKGTTWKKKNHKYIARIGTSGNYRYFYSNAEYQAYLKFQNFKNTVGNRFAWWGTLDTDDSQNKNFSFSRVKDKVKNFFSRQERKVKSQLYSLNNTIKKILKINTDKSNGKVMTQNNGKGKPGEIYIKNKNGSIKKVKPQLDRETLKSVNVLKKFRNRVEEFYNQMRINNPVSFKGLKHKRNKNMSADEDMARVNPYLLDSDTFTINCAYCTAAYELRRRGYDVEADDYHDGSKADENRNTIVEIYSWYKHKNPEATSLSQRFKEYPGLMEKNLDTKYDVAQLETAILKQGEGARGQMCFLWYLGGGHSVVYEVENGKVILRDCQHNKKISIEEYANKAYHAYYFRTDNDELSNNILQCVKNKQTDTICPGDDGKSDKDIKSLLSDFERAGFTPAYVGDGTYKVSIDNSSNSSDDSSYLILNTDSDGKISTEYYDTYMARRLSKNA